MSESCVPHPLTQPNLPDTAASTVGEDPAAPGSPPRKGDAADSSKLSSYDVRSSKVRFPSVEGQSFDRSSDKQTSSHGEAEELPDTHESKSTDAEAIGAHFWEMLTILVDLIWEPESMAEKLVATTKYFFELGVRQAHLETIGYAICTTMQ
eukprot:CAMPEP_0169450498 /NCGR_PEP_ID=MMETSP1042-20121227/13186_1 /TAXON_ID=464988 /ORGANISM="Hemiselmis andersenii, Strain CCMP1180" /LENGTH=150 /DNA_ID=CAMNT_0009562327 /DNA_START=486 /DNA_END=936 /DNA_ORIENTATION=-